MVRRELRLRNQKSCTRDSKACTATCLLQTCFPIVQWALSPPFRVVVMTRLCAQGSTGPRGAPDPGAAQPRAGLFPRSSWVSRGWLKVTGLCPLAF